MQNGKEVLMIRVRQQKDRKQEQGGYLVSATLLSFTITKLCMNKTIGIILIGTRAAPKRKLFTGSSEISL